jgi:hypothetical protein
MCLLDGLLGQIGGSDQIAGLAAQFGISEAQVQGAVAALGQAHDQPGDTVGTAAASTGLSADVLQGILGQIGGEGTLGKISSLIDRDGDGNPLNDLTGFAGKLFG